MVCPTLTSWGNYEVQLFLFSCLTEKQKFQIQSQQAKPQAGSGERSQGVCLKLNHLNTQAPGTSGDVHLIFHGTHPKSGTLCLKPCDCPSSNSSSEQGKDLGSYQIQSNIQAVPGTLPVAAAGPGTAKGGPALHPGRLPCTCCANTGIGTIHQ